MILFEINLKGVLLNNFIGSFEKYSGKDFGADTVTKCSHIHLYYLCLERLYPCQLSGFFFLALVNPSYAQIILTECSEDSHCQCQSGLIPHCELTTFGNTCQCKQPNSKYMLRFLRFSKQVYFNGSNI